MARRSPYLAMLASAALVLLLSNSPVHALGPMLETGGGGASRTDCYATFKSTLNIPAARPRNVRCVDGDPDCDADGTVDGVCSFAVAVCANSTFDTARCNSTGIEALNVLHSNDDGTDPDFDPDLQALQAGVDNTIEPPTNVADLCTAPSTIQVRIKGPLGKPLAMRDRCGRGVQVLRLSTLPSPLVGASDSDRLRLICLPADEDVFGCDADHLFAGTFDRIQKQVLSTSCAVGTCHDSESFPLAANLLLESGAAYANLVNQSPTNGPALGLGWMRVAPGSSATSYLYHKIMNDLDDAAGLGERMPRPPGRPMLHPSLREVIRLWIDAGAPDTGWVPNTF